MWLPTTSNSSRLFLAGHVSVVALLLLSVSCASKNAPKEAPADPKQVDQEDFPKFPWPPPEASARTVISDQLLGKHENAKVSDIEQMICRALDANGYVERSYFAVPSGFAMVTRLEQINDDATSMAKPEDRWAIELTRFKQFSLEAYLRALFLANPGHFRVIVFVITPMPFSESKVTVRRDEALAWLKDGWNTLPVFVGKQNYSAEHVCTALIYEFIQAERGKVVRPKVPGVFSAADHLLKSRISAAFMK